jgi:hypothetical protein
MSLLLCAATVALWVRSYSHGDQVAWLSEDARRCVRSDRGYVEWEVYRREAAYDRYVASDRHPHWDLGYRAYDVEGSRWPEYDGREFPIAWADGVTRRRGIDRSRGTWAFTIPPSGIYGSPMGASWYSVRIPHRLAALACALPPLCVLAVRALGRRRRRRRLDMGLCPACGYDLRATPDRCPECGRHTASPARVARPPNTEG